MRLTRRALSRYAPRLVDLSDGRMSSAVLVPLYAVDGRYHVLFTKRSEHVEYHKAQISFPGGAEDPGDADLLFTALRETHEEIGVHPDHIEVIGQLDDFVTITNFRVRPYVGLITRSPYEFAFDEREVAELLSVPVAHLSDPANCIDEVRHLEGRGEVLMRSYAWGEHVIWGATAMMLRHFLELVEREGSIDELIRQIEEGSA